MRAIFVSYRREDAEGEAGRLFDDLVGVFGYHSVFMDVAAIQVGRDFRKAIDENVATCGVVLAIIGEDWVDAKNEVGQRRLDDPSDFVRLEIASALKRGIPVIPVLVQGAKMPRAEQLPNDLRGLAFRMVVELTHARWASDVQLLIKALRTTPVLEPVAQSLSAPADGPRLRQKRLPGSAWLDWILEKARSARVGKNARKSVDFPGAPRARPEVEQVELPNDLLVDNVHFTLTGPRVLALGRVHELRFWVHLEEQRSTVLRRASAAHGLPISEISEKSEGPYPLQRGSRLSIRLRIDGLKCLDSHKWITWTGEIGSTAFVVDVPASASEKTYPATASIRLNGCEIARMSFVVRVGPAKPDINEIPSITTTHRSAFASYASQDRVEVLKRIQGIEAAYKGLDVFVDVVDLRSGQNWEQELKRRISKSDVFYLFWCRHAKGSEWVDKEWHWALEAKGKDFIDPIPLEAPDVAPPPQELTAKHFNDPLLAFIAAAGGGHSR